MFGLSLAHISGFFGPLTFDALLFDDLLVKRANVIFMIINTHVGKGAII